jgi:predicted transcriptional regulator
MSEAMFFAYLVLRANWKAGPRRYDDVVYDLERGQLVIGERKLAEDFGWTRKKVRGVLRRFKSTNMITRKRSHLGAQHTPIITISNYDVFQLQTEAEGPGEGPTRAQQGPSEGPPKNKGNKGNKGKTNNYRFAGRVIRLTDEDYAAWEKAYPEIDLRSELQALDDYYDSNLSDADRKKWFPRCSAALAKKNRQAASLRDREQPEFDDVIH